MSGKCQKHLLKLVGTKGAVKRDSVFTRLSSLWKEHVLKKQWLLEDFAIRVRNLHYFVKV